MIFSVCLVVKPVGEPDAGNRHVRFDERGWETERCHMAQATAPILRLYRSAKFRTAQKMSGDQREADELTSMASASRARRYCSEEAHLALRFGTVVLQRPRNTIEKDLPASVTLNFVEVIEQHAPKGAELFC
jgi:hypothetical protein